MTMRQLRRMYSWISARIQCTAKETRRTPLLGIEALDRLHQADVALLHQIVERQAVAGVAAGDVNNETQMGHHQAARRLQILLVAQLAAQLTLLPGVEDRDAVGHLDVLVDAAEGDGGQHAGSLGNQGLAHVWILIS
ncbi:hypothetical protein JCM17961_16810 [Endothiovibrio diazotrophicus]